MRRRILLADDSVTIQKVIELTFLDEDYEVKAVSNGDEAIAALQQANPDFVIADVHMPGANGYEVCRRSKELRPDIPVLLLVGTFEPFDEGQSRTVGADSFLKKPFDSQELLQRVEELLAARSEPAPSAAAPSTADLLPKPTPTKDPPPAGGGATGEPFLPELPPLELGSSQPEPALPATDWGSFQVEPPPLPVPDPLPAPTTFTLAEDRPFAPRGESAFEPFPLEEAPLGGPAPSIDESALLPAGEPLYEFEEEPAAAGPEGEPAPLFEEPSFEAPSFGEPSFHEPYPSLEPSFSPTETVRLDTRAFQPPGFATTPEERLGVPQGAVPLVESRAETEARIEAPAPPSIEASHEPASTAAIASAAAPAAAAPATNGGGRLSDEDVDRIARRVVELMADRAIRDVAWEVIPDMAELVIRDRLRELESQAESFE